MRFGKLWPVQPRKIEAIVLRRTNYGEADRILNLLTPEGKLSVIAKGVRRPKSKLAGGLELFAVCDLTVMRGKGELGLVTSARMQQFYGNILHDYDRMQLGYDVIKRVNRATETVAEPEFYSLLRQSLENLNDATISTGLIELWFILQLDILLGHGLNLATDREGHKLQQDHFYNYDYADNAFYDHPSAQVSGGHIKLLRLASAKSPKIIHQVSGIQELLPTCLDVVRRLA